MFNIKKCSICIVIFLASYGVKGQVKFNTLTIVADTVANARYKGTKVNILQRAAFIRSNLNEKINIESGVAFQIEIENNQIKIPGFKRLIIYSDTIITLSINTLAEVVVKSKKKIVSETLTGFVYYPQNDTVFKEKSLLLSLQRLPFIIVEDEHSLPKYKTTQKILFLINGKQRKGLENGWLDVLRAIKAKDIFKVELMEDIPILYQNQGYNIVINISTLDANLSGVSLSAVITYDQRKNLNKNIGGTFLRKISDYSIQGAVEGDKTEGLQNTRVYNLDTSIINNSYSVTNQFKSYRFNAGFGCRIDSFNDVGLNVLFNNYDYHTQYTNLYAFPIPTNNTNNQSQRNFITINASLVNRKRKSIVKSFSFSGNFFQNIAGNRLAYIVPNAYDSIYNESKSPQLTYIAEYNNLNTKNDNLQKESGLQVYNKNLVQDYYKYNLNQLTNEKSNLLSAKNDTVQLGQVSIRPYFKVGKNITTNKRITFSFSSELFVVHNNKKLFNTFFLPTTRISFKKIITSKLSVRYIGELSFYKPSIDYLALVQLETDPLRKNIGSTKIIPSKGFEGSIELVHRNKSTVSNTVSFFYSIDNIGYFRKYEAASNTLISLANNGSKSYGIGNNFSYQMLSTKKTSFSFGAYINFLHSTNTEFNTRYSGFTFSGWHNFSYEISPKLGRVSFLSVLNGNQNGVQGYNQGSVKYWGSYWIPIIKKHLFLTLTAQNFLLKKLNRLTYTYNDDYRSYTNTISPFRLISVRVGYNFSTIKMAKYAAKKTTEILGEKSGN